MAGGANRPKSKMSDATSKYSAVVFTVPIEKQKKEQPKESERTDEEDEDYEDDFEDDFEPYETSNEDQRTDANGKSNTSGVVPKEDPQAVSNQVDQQHQGAVNIEIQRDARDASVKSQEARRQNAQAATAASAQSAFGHLEEEKDVVPNLDADLVGYNAKSRAQSHVQGIRRDRASPRSVVTHISAGYGVQNRVPKKQLAHYNIQKNIHPFHALELAMVRASKYFKI